MGRTEMAPSKAAQWIHLWHHISLMRTLHSRGTATVCPRWDWHPYALIPQQQIKTLVLISDH